MLARIGGVCALVSGAALILCNTLGLFCPSLLSPWIFRSGYIETHRKLSARACRDALARRQGESDSDYVVRANQVVSDAHIHTNRRHTFFLENWPMWAFAKVYTPAEYTQNADRIIRSGGALCGQAALVLMDACRKNGIEARQLGLAGHVVLEAKTENGWRVCDPDYGVMPGFSLKDAERPENRETIARAYTDAGYTQHDVNMIVGFYQTPSDNVTMPVYGQLCPRLWIIERTSEYLKWIVPVLLLGVGSLAFPRVRKRTQRLLRMRISQS